MPCPPAAGNAAAATTAATTTTATATRVRMMALEDPYLPSGFQVGRRY